MGTLSFGIKWSLPAFYPASGDFEHSECLIFIFWSRNRVLDNLKDYSVKALVNAVDHLGTVAYKLNDLLSQQTSEISTTELRAASLAQVYLYSMYTMYTQLGQVLNCWHQCMFGWVSVLLVCNMNWQMCKIGLITDCMSHKCIWTQILIGFTSKYHQLVRHFCGTHSFDFVFVLCHGSECVLVKSIQIGKGWSSNHWQKQCMLITSIMYYQV